MESPTLDFELTSIDEPADAASTTEPPAAPSIDEIAKTARVDALLAEIRKDYERPRFSLRDIADEALEIDMLLAAAEGDLTPELERRFDELAGRLFSKADGVGDFRAALREESNRYIDEAKRLQRREKAVEARLDRFERFVEMQMRRMKRDEIAGDFWTIKIGTNPPALKIVNEAALPEPYRTVAEVKKEEVTIDTDKLKADLKLWEQACDALTSAYAKAMKLHAKSVAKLQAQLLPDGQTIELPPEPTVPTYPEPPVPETVAKLTRATKLNFR